MSRWSIGLTTSALCFALLAPGCETRATAKPEGGLDPSIEDAGAGEAATIGDAGAACSPGDIKNFKPSWAPPTKFYQGKCTDKQISDLLSCYFDEKGKPPNCAQLSADTANGDCTACLFTAEVVLQAGPLVVDGSSARLNVPGCIATLEGNVSSESCGAKYKAATDCAFAACDESCPGDDEAAVAARSACVDESLTTVCKTYATAAECADDLLGSGGKAAACAAGGTFFESATVLAKLFCGKSAADAGTDGN